jgi:hypothetical protein
MGAVSAIRNDAKYRDLYARIVAVGRHRKISLVAAMSNILRRIAAVSKANHPG